MERNNLKYMPLKVADIFCGAGGLSYGFSHNNFFDMVWANDIDKDALDSLL